MHCNKVYCLTVHLVYILKCMFIKLVILYWITYYINKNLKLFKMGMKTHETRRDHWGGNKPPIQIWTPLLEHYMKLKYCADQESKQGFVIITTPAIPSCLSFSVIPFPYLKIFILFIFTLHVLLLCYKLVYRTSRDHGCSFLENSIAQQTTRTQLVISLQVAFSSWVYILSSVFRQVHLQVCFPVCILCFSHVHYTYYYIIIIPQLLHLLFPSNRKINLLVYIIIKIIILIL